MELLKISDVVRITGFCDKTIRRLEKEGKFPESRKISERGTRWREAEVRSWIDNQWIDERREDRDGEI